MPRCLVFSRFVLQRNANFRYFIASNIIPNNHKHAIQAITKVTNTKMVPELRLHLIDESCKLWTSKPEECPFQDPFWAFFWPGGQVLTRYILDHPEVVRNRKVLDIGSGCGACAIAAKLSGALHVVANDIDDVAAQAICINAELNKCTLEISTQNLIGKQCGDYDIIMLGDMFYDVEFSDRLRKWLANQMTPLSKRAIFGDPGRPYLRTWPAECLKILAKYELPGGLTRENFGLTEGFVVEIIHEKRGS